MVAANGTTVAFLGNAGIPMIQRIVRIPKHWDEIVLTAAIYGEILPDQPDAKALTEFLSRQKEADPIRFPDLSLTVVKLMGAGKYVPLDPGEPPIGHFTLAVTDYTHGTAPNLRLCRSHHPAAGKNRSGQGREPLYNRRTHGPVCMADREGERVKEG
jgi:exoribonuclease-2